MKLDLPIRERVPQWLGIVTMFVVIFPVIMLNGAYTGSSIDVSGALGVMSEDIMMAYYATSLGMAVAYPIVSGFRTEVPPKTLILSSLIIQLMLCFVCSKTSYIQVLTVCSFLIGFMKAFLMLEFIVLLKPFFSPGNIRSQFYLYFYPLVFSGGQISSFVTAELAYRYHWQHMYVFMMILLLVAICFVLAFFRYIPKPVKLPFAKIDFMSMLVASVAILGIMYVFCYGKVLDWFSDPRICLLSVLCPILLVVFLFCQKHSPKFYIGLVPLRNSKRLGAYFFMFVAMFFAGSSTLITQYLTRVMDIDMVHVNALNLVSLPGFVAGAIFTYFWLRQQRWWFRKLVASGLLCFTVYFLLVFLALSREGNYYLFFLPMFFKGMGMMIVFMSLGVYVVEDLDPKFMLSNTFFMISIRSVLAPIISYSFFSNLAYWYENRTMSGLSGAFTWLDEPVARNFRAVSGQAMSQGHSYTESMSLATRNFQLELSKQAYVCGIRQIMFLFAVISLSIAVGVSFIHFHKTLKVKEVKAGEDMA